MLRAIEPEPSHIAPPMHVPEASGGLPQHHKGCYLRHKLPRRRTTAYTILQICQQVAVSHWTKSIGSMSHLAAKQYGSLSI